MLARLAANARSLLLGIANEEASFARRGFVYGSASARVHLERVSGWFVHGYNSALALDGEELVAELDDVPLAFRGFAFEGAAMAAGVLDELALFGRGRWQRLHDLAGDRYSYLICVGVGWAWARVPVRVAERVATLPLFHRWLAVDGLGFHCGYFDLSTSVGKQVYMRGVSGYSCRAFDQGLGRSLWFSRSGQPDLIAAAIALFDESRRADLWSGAGLACAYSGGVERSQIETLRRLSGAWAPAVAQGAALAAEARVRAAETVAWTELACEVLCGSGAETAAACARECRESACSSSSVETYELWIGKLREVYSRRLPSGERPAS